MITRKTLLFCAAILSATPSFGSVQPVPHASEKELELEYAQVRKLAMRDPKVREAFDQAERRLQQRMLEIDPILAPLIDRERARQAEQPPLVHPFRAATAVKPAPSGATHTVIQGETLGSIAARYKVTVTELKEANGITDERHLQVGQKLTIPGREKAAPAPTAKPAAATTTSAASPTPSRDDSIWSRITHTLQ